MVLSFQTSTSHFHLWKGELCMKGSIHFRKDRGWWFVSWYHKTKGEIKGKNYKINKYKGHILHQTHPEKDKDQGYRNAQKLLSLMQADIERGVFRIEKYTKEMPSDVIPYLWEWIHAIEDTLKPGTYKDYQNSIRNHLEPFFEKNDFQLHEIQYYILMKLLKSIKREGKGKLNVMYCLRNCLDYAWRSGRIPFVPPFPRKKQYQIDKKKPVWLPEKRQLAILEAIPKDHQPIFYWLKYHYRRPGEAMAFHKEDFDGEIFTIRRTFSARKLTDSTKTGEIHEIPMAEKFKIFVEIEGRKQKKAGIISPFFFVNPEGRKKGKHYTERVLNKTWKKACEEVGENIGLYPGTKHSSCGQFLNEKGGTPDELQTITDHARRESVARYGKMEVLRRKELMDRESKVVDIRGNVGGKKKWH